MCAPENRPAPFQSCCYVLTIAPIEDCACYAATRGIACSCGGRPPATLAVNRLLRQRSVDSRSQCRSRLCGCEPRIVLNELFVVCNVSPGQYSQHMHVQITRQFCQYRVSTASPLCITSSNLADSRGRTTGRDPVEQSIKTAPCITAIRRACRPIRSGPSSLLLSLRPGRLHWVQLLLVVAADDIQNSGSARCFAVPSLWGENEV